MQKNLFVELSKLKNDLADSKEEARKLMVLETGLLRTLRDIKDGETNIDELNISEVDILNEFEDLEWIPKHLVSIIDEIREWVFTKSIKN